MLLRVRRLIVRMIIRTEINIILFLCHGGHSELLGMGGLEASQNNIGHRTHIGQTTKGRVVKSG